MHRKLLGAAIAVALAPPARQATPPPRFEERARDAGLTDPGCSWAFALADPDQDGDVDLFYTNHVVDQLARKGHPTRSRLYENQGRLRFVEATGRGLDEAMIDAHHASWLDVDGDGDLDLFVAQGTPKWDKPDHRNRLFLQEEGHFHAVPLEDDAGGLGWRTRGGAWGDLDGDGDADFVGAGVVSTDGRQGSGTLVLENRGAGALVARGAALGLVRPNEESVYAGIADLDGDGSPEVLVTPHTGLYWRRPDGRYRDEALDRGLDPTLDASSAAWGDFDDDGDLDLVLNVTNSVLVRIGAEAPRPVGPRLYRNDGAGRFTDATALLGPYPRVRYASVTFGDVDNDGDLDLFAASGRANTPHLLLLNQGASGGFAFTDFSEVLRHPHAGGHTDAALADLDGDGRLDILIASGHGDCTSSPLAPPELWANRGGSAQHALVQLVSTRSAPRGLGARVSLRTRRGVQHRFQLGAHHLSTDSLPLHFGLGDADRVVDIEVRWPTGVVERYPGGRANRTFTLVEGEGTPLR